MSGEGMDRLVSRYMVRVEGAPSDGPPLSQRDDDGAAWKDMP